ncbi:olfactory marker protein-like [Sinocyclocheilus rhinocerous]|uniref:Olfactory marker protein-like n=1 Tax=Sinocyclocheilus rhinocerous TaxID=307959 RepID=A0A673L6Z6_9TELE|nr:PREDICTED: olfactory marker protein-like [Sinocyclocheilus rhinocerous]
MSLELTFNLDIQLTEMMRLRVQSLQQRGQKRQDGERLLKSNEHVYHLDFSEQALHFTRWNIRMCAPGRLNIIATSQLWTPDLTHLMTRQLLEPTGLFWKSTDDELLQCYEADAQEFGERIAELAKVRKVMYFLFAFEDGLSPENIECSIEFQK